LETTSEVFQGFLTGFYSINLMSGKYGSLLDIMPEPSKDAGHQFTLNGERHSLRGTIAFISGDNLGSQLIGGFKEGAGARLKCRHCMGSANDIQTKVCKISWLF